MSAGWGGVTDGGGLSPSWKESRSPWEEPASGALWGAGDHTWPREKQQRGSSEPGAGGGGGSRGLPPPWGRTTW